MAGNAEVHAVAESIGRSGNSFWKICRNAITKLLRTSSPKNEDADLPEPRTVAVAVGQFGNNLLKTVANDNPGNLIMSPLSAQVVLAMAAYGAAGKTATQMRSALFIPAENDVGQSDYKSIIKTLSAVKGVKLHLASKIYIASRFNMKPRFKELTAKKFYSSSEEIDFNDWAEAAKTINTWCAEKTENRIKNLIPTECIDSELAMVLVNAVYFMGEWQVKFNPVKTRDCPFHIAKDKTISVPTMFVRHNLRFGDLPKLNASFIEIPYKENKVSMIIILPDEVNGLQEIQNNLHLVNLKQNLKQSDPKEVQLFLPKFKIESTLFLEEPLEKLGMTDMFGEEADFSGISDTPLNVSQVIQKAFIEVNEEGTEAAAATGSRQVTCAPRRFRIDKPFYYAIYHRETGISVFTGVVHQPN